MTAVVIAEDDADIRDLLVFKLMQDGFDVRAVGDGPAALDAVATERPDLVILDVMMPGMSGLDVCQRLRSEQATKNLPVILLTARAQEADVESGFGVGADDYVTKPFSPRELLSRVHAVLARVGQ
ncbi:response regulator transcription factor [Lentzea aerocolonigenes]|uniref:response regulator transcription factor n=1 Tax=Lentzea aerocolonigenes TaxID=68170 RepID=UPI0004C3E71E|nr:response regulator [Lentzea aerocolonigenes]MCP2243577.1 Response regulator receiver domain-containing protein [Lentzea aerocolonigenes]